MKALLRKFDNDCFVYTDVVYECGSFKTPDGRIVNENGIIHIVKDNRKNKVRCKGCGDLIKNTPEDIEAHFKEREDKKNCLTCSHVKESYRKASIGRKYKPHPTEEGQYICEHQYKTDLYCSHGGGTRLINTTESDEKCKYLMCRKMGVTEVTNDFFLDYPGAFTTFPTVDKLIEKNWIFESMNSNFIVYHHKRMTTLKAIVNNKGIINNFRACYKHSDAVDIVYSDKYEKAFYLVGGKYSTGHCSDLTQAKAESYIAKIKELY